MSRATWEVSIDVWPHQVNVYCSEDDIEQEVASKLAKKYDLAEPERFVIIDTINLTEVHRADDVVGEDYDNQGAEA